MKRIFYVIGREPAHSKEANQLLKAFDLGIEGAFVPFAHKATATVSDMATAEKLARQPDAIRQAYEHQGCVDVVVVEVGE